MGRYVIVLSCVDYNNKNLRDVSHGGPRGRPLKTSQFFAKMLKFPESLT